MHHILSGFQRKSQDDLKHDLIGSPQPTSGERLPAQADQRAEPSFRGIGIEALLTVVGFGRHASQPCNEHGQGMQ